AQRQLDELVEGKKRVPPHDVADSQLADQASHRSLGFQISRLTCCAADEVQLQSNARSSRSGHRLDHILDALLLPEGAGEQEAQRLVGSHLTRDKRKPFDIDSENVNLKLLRRASQLLYPRGHRGPEGQHFRRSLKSGRIAVLPLALAPELVDVRSVETHEPRHTERSRQRSISRRDIAEVRVEHSGTHSCESDPIRWVEPLPSGPVPDSTGETLRIDRARVQAGEFLPVCEAIAKDYRGIAGQKSEVVVQPIHGSTNEFVRSLHRDHRRLTSERSLGLRWNVHHRDLPGRMDG